jgi:hypothetical protein
MHLDTARLLLLHTPPPAASSASHCHRVIEVLTHLLDIVSPWSQLIPPSHNMYNHAPDDWKPLTYTSVLCCEWMLAICDDMKTRSGSLLAHTASLLSSISHGLSLRCYPSPYQTRQ